MPTWFKVLPVWSAGKDFPLLSAFIQDGRLLGEVSDISVFSTNILNPVGDMGDRRMEFDY